MKDFSPAVGMTPLIFWRVFGTTRWRLRSDYISSPPRGSAIKLPAIRESDGMPAALWYGAAIEMN